MALRDALIGMVLAAAGGASATGAEPDVRATPRPEQGKPLFGQRDGQYFEDRAEMEKLKAKSPQLYQVMRKRADETKAKLEAAQKSPSSSSVPDPRLPPPPPGSLDALSGKAPRGAAAAPAAKPSPTGESVLSAEGVAKEIVFPGAKKAKASPAPPKRR